MEMDKVMDLGVFACPLNISDKLDPEIDMLDSRS